MAVSPAAASPNTPERRDLSGELSNVGPASGSPAAAADPGAAQAQFDALASGEAARQGFRRIQQGLREIQACHARVNQQLREAAQGAPARGAGEAEGDNAPQAAPQRVWAYLEIFSHARDMAVHAHNGIPHFVKDYPHLAGLVALVCFVFGASLVLPTFIANLLTGGALLYLSCRIFRVIFANPQGYAADIEQERLHGMGVRSAERHAHHVARHLQRIAAQSPGALPNS